MVFTKPEIIEWQSQYPILKDIMDLNPVFWSNPNLKNVEEMDSLPLSREDIEEAELRWQRFAPFLERAFPETSSTNGIIESPLEEISQMKEEYLPDMEGTFYLKCDHELPVAGSIKARGGFYEVLQYAEKLALESGILRKDENYDVFSTDRFKSFFNQYSIGVGSTGNLGLSIGIISAKLGFNVSVYMSMDAKQWKKDLLRENGAEVLEFEGDFSEAILAGREATEADPNGYFIDDEDSEHLFLGYSVAALRLEKQLKEKGITVDADHPLIVYLPCGVGGSPGGITFGMKHVLGNHVHCIFVEPTHSPSVLIGLLTGEMDNVSVHDFGIDNRTEADGLAVGRPSRFATIISDQLVSGIYTIEDNGLYRQLANLADSEGIYLEPSAASGLIGPDRIYPYTEANNIKLSHATHIAWSTGGSLVPDDHMAVFYNKGKSLG
ncbi:D-serine ammonia-lyase [Lentibacillus amyloliquefaciens]|uniref:Probable D-serine dehydratase n=1 Tax=Lentibacillus amyloliquefaciens TaxID=1472767 RepID=A0A0U4F2V3_9BACI|nr:D-serine ammonia-lyase [Lentibacillus amyloliquefaciens]ALX47894.1 D-serine dehydratase [Lentibacillus amyloliquefaciens]